MLNLPYTFQYFFYSKPIDMRKSFNGLYVLTMENFVHDNLPGKMFVFSNRKKDKLKILYWDYDGFAIWYKQLHKGKFQFPNSDDNIQVFSAEILQQIFYGFDVNFLKKQKRFHLNMI